MKIAYLVPKMLSDQILQFVNVWTNISKYKEQINRNACHVAINANNVQLQTKIVLHVPKILFVKFLLIAHVKLDTLK
jgi:hypothetical protein